MTTTTLASAPFWSRNWQRLKDIAEAMGYDHAQYTVDRMAWLQAELVDVKVRVAQQCQCEPGRVCESHFGRTCRRCIDSGHADRGRNLLLGACCALLDLRFGHSRITHGCLRRRLERTARHRLANLRWCVVTELYGAGTGNGGTGQMIDRRIARAGL